MNVGDKVYKRMGYRFPGIVRAIFKTSAGETRLVVECTAEEVAGLLHIYNPDQIQVTTPTVHPDVKLLARALTKAHYEGRFGMENKIAVTQNVDANWCDLYVDTAISLLKELGLE